MTRTALLPGLLLAGALLPAQGPLEWRLGPEDFAWYDLERAELFREPAREGGFREELRRTAVTKPASGVFGYEVTPAGATLQTSELHRVPFAAGMCLPGGEARTGRAKARWLFPALGEYGRVLVEGEWSTEKPAAGIVRQSGAFTLAQPKGKLRAGGAELPWSPPARSLEGMSLGLEREVDLERGLVVGLRSRLKGVTRPFGAMDEAQDAPIQVEDTYTFRQLFPYRYEGFADEVREAIAGGVRQLRWEMSHEHRFAPVAPGDLRDFHPGFVALALLTLRKAEVSGTDPLVRRCLDYLRTQPVLNTYSLGVALMALEAHYAPLGEREMLLAGEIDRPFPRRADPDDRKLMEEWVARLAAYVDPAVDRGYHARWRYAGEQDFDNSNTQYAVLGLHSASLCGIPIPGRLLQGVAEHFVRMQERDGPELPAPVLATYRELAREGRAAGRGTTTKAPARGWSYRDPGRATGSMTTAGIATLTIVSAMVPPPARTAKAWGKVRTALREGLTWLYHNLSVRENPGQGQVWYHYYLYGLERAMELGAVARLGERDWYWEGAVHLLRSRTAPQGGWAGPEDSCFAVLFLKKAQLPVTTGR